MSLTYGFYNSLNGDRKYDAVQLSSIFDGIIRDGVFATIGSALAVTADSGLTVKVGTGRAWFNRTWTLNDSVFPIDAEDSEVLLDRIDAVVLEINSSEETRANIIKIVKGTPSSSPMRPNMVNDDLVHQYPLCYIYRTARSTEIVQSDITNAIGTEECPFVTGILDVVSIDDFIAQWKDEFDRWMETEQSDYDEWYANMTAAMAANSAAFDAWFATIKSKFSEDPAGSLQNQIDAHSGDTSNPHKVTYELIKSESNLAPTKEEFDRLSGVTDNIQKQLDGKVGANHGTHVSYGTNNPNMDGIASAGSASSVSRSDHIHPTDTSRAPAYSYGTTSLTPGSSSLETGKLHFVYE